MHFVMSILLVAALITGLIALRQFKRAKELAAKASGYGIWVNGIAVSP